MMGLGMVPNTTTTTTTTPISLPPNQPKHHHHHHHHPLNPRNPSPIFSTTATPKTPSLNCSFKTRAAVEEGGFTAEKTLYELLGIEAEEASFEEIKKAYKQLARKYHPDVSPPDRTEEFTRRFIEVHEAYETLSDPSRRATYDQVLAGGLPLSFSTRRRFHEDLDEKSQWKKRWQYQVEELKKKSMYKEGSAENLSWGARMRHQRAESSSA